MQRQASFVALSQDGLHFEARDEVLGRFYFRVFQHDGWHYALAKNANRNGLIYRSRDGLTGFEPGPEYLPGVRHTALWLEGDALWVVYSLVGEAPERLHLTRADLTRPWRRWQIPAGRKLLEPETDYEGVGLPLEPSVHGVARGPVRQLRDPGVFREDGRIYLIYSIAGEQGLALAELKRHRDA